MFKPKQNEKGSSHRRRNILLGILGIVAIILALGLGLGLGLGLKKNNNDDNDKHKSGNDGSSTDGDSSSARKKVWTPKVGERWQISLSVPIEVTEDTELTPDVGVYDLDLYDGTKETFDELHIRGKKVICYFSAGSREDWREDAEEFPEEDLGDSLGDWPGEVWVNVSSNAVRDIMAARIQLAGEKGCDAIDPDNVDGFQNDNGLGLTSEDAVSFVKFMADEAKTHGMSTGLKNAGDIIPDVLPFVQFCVNEQCSEYDECDTFAAFIEAEKAVFHIEYPDGAATVRGIAASAVDDKCNAEGSDQFSTVLKTMDLGLWVQYCDGKIFNELAES